MELKVYGISFVKIREFDSQGRRACSEGHGRVANLIPFQQLDQIWLTKNLY